MFHSLHPPFCHSCFHRSPKQRARPQPKAPAPQPTKKGPTHPWGAPCWGAFEQSPDCLHAGTLDAGPSMRPSELGPWASPPGQTWGEDRPEIVFVFPPLFLSLPLIFFLSSPAVFSALQFAPTTHHPSIWLPASPQLLPHPEVPTWPMGEPRMEPSGDQHTWLLWWLRG